MSYRIAENKDFQLHYSLLYKSMSYVMLYNETSDWVGVSNDFMKLKMKLSNFRAHEFSPDNFNEEKQLK